MLSFYSVLAQDLLIDFGKVYTALISAIVRKRKLLEFKPQAGRLPLAKSKDPSLR